MEYSIKTIINNKEYREIFDAESSEEAYNKAKKDAEQKNENIEFPDLEHCTIEQVISSDNDTDSIEKDESANPSGLYPYDPTYSSIDIEEVPFSIFEYLRQLSKGRIIVNPDFQRHSVWKPIQKSKFIESIILNFPLPPIYLNQNKENKYIVIDGLQRTITLSEFFNDKFQLKGLEALPSYNDKKFSDLSDILQSKLENKKLTIFSLKPSTPMVVIYDLFNRINTGGTQLNRQEVRNCIFIGESTKLLLELSSNEKFQNAIDHGISPKRMKDREVVLRYLAFKWGDYPNNYEGNLSNYLESFMVKINKMDQPQIDEIRKDFLRVMIWAYKLWENKCFRIPSEKTRGVINTAILESVCLFLSNKDDEYLERNRNTIKNNYETLLKDTTYISAVTRATGSKQNVSNRFQKAKDILSTNTK
jgi:hypothetical protein